MNILFFLILAAPLIGYRFKSRYFMDDRLSSD